MAGETRALASRHKWRNPPPPGRRVPSSTLGSTLGWNQGRLSLYRIPADTGDIPPARPALCRQPQMRQTHSSAATTLIRWLDVAGSVWSSAFRRVRESCGAAAPFPITLGFKGQADCLTRVNAEPRTGQTQAQRPPQESGQIASVRTRSGVAAARNRAKQSQFAAGRASDKCFCERELCRSYPAGGFCETKPNGTSFCRPKRRRIRRENAVAPPRARRGFEKPCPNLSHGLQSGGSRYITRF